MMFSRPIEGVFQSDRHGRATVREEPRFFAVYRRKSPPIVDGDVHEFAALPPLRLATAEMLGPSTDPAANGLWTGSEDVGVEAWTAWDDTHFHMAVRVRDGRTKSQTPIIQGKESG